MHILNLYRLTCFEFGTSVIFKKISQSMLNMVSPNKKIKIDEEHVETSNISADNSNKTDVENVGSVTQELLRNPAILSVLQDKVNSIAGRSSGYIESLPGHVKRRIDALKNIQIEATDIEAKFYEEFHQLKSKYHELYLPLYERRNKIINGTYEPTENECKLPTIEDKKEKEEMPSPGKEKAKQEAKDTKSNIDGKDEPRTRLDMKGIPEFWLTIFKNVDILRDMIQEHDEPVLTKLSDIKISYNEGPLNPMGCKLHFYFEPNEYFTNSVLTKEYEMKCIPSKANPYTFEGPEIVKCKGCTIDWKDGKNLTLLTRVATDDEDSELNTEKPNTGSFFTFFNPPQIPDVNETEIDTETQDVLEQDFEVENYLRERIIPRAVLFFTGEALQDDDDNEDDDDEVTDEDECDDEEDPDWDPSKHKGSATPQDCKQQ